MNTDHINETDPVEAHRDTPMIGYLFPFNNGTMIGRVTLPMITSQHDADRLCAMIQFLSRDARENLVTP